MTGQAPRPSRLAGRLVIAAAAMVALVVGGTGGLVLGTELVLGSPEPRDLPDLPPDFPDPSVQYLPGLTVSEVTSSLAGLGFECEELSTWPGAPDLQECLEAGGGGRLSARIEYDSESAVRALITSCYRRAEDTTRRCEDGFQSSVHIALASQPPAAREQARDRVERYAEEVAVIRDGSEVVTRAGEIALTMSVVSFDDGDAVYKLDLRRA